jgi:IMP dehydrogenase
MTQTRQVGEVMTSDPITVVSTASLAEAVSVLDSKKITGLPVVDASGALVGVLSQTDLVRARSNTIPATAGLEEAARVMEERRVHRLVVVDDKATPIGIISTSDLVRSWLR